MVCLNCQETFRNDNEMSQKEKLIQQSTRKLIHKKFLFFLKLSILNNKKSLQSPKSLQTLSFDTFIKNESDKNLIELIPKQCLINIIYDSIYEKYQPAYNLFKMLHEKDTKKFECVCYKNYSEKLVFHLPTFKVIAFPFKKNFVEKMLNSVETKTSGKRDKDGKLIVYNLTNHESLKKMYNKIKNITFSCIVNNNFILNIPDFWF